MGGEGEGFQSDYYNSHSTLRRYIVDKRKEKGSVCLHKEWATIADPFPYQTMVRDITAFAPEFREEVTSLQELFPPKSHCFILGTPHYGSLAEVGVVGGWSLCDESICMCSVCTI